MDMIVLAAFVTLQTLDGRDAVINSEQVASMLSAQDGEGNKLLAAGVHCMINLTNGKFVSVHDDCDVVLRKLEEAK
jgi:uncharacterized protein YlzI (FlbEa/FlbD family)